MKILGLILKKEKHLTRAIKYENSSYATIRTLNEMHSSWNCMRVLACQKSVLQNWVLGLERTYNVRDTRIRRRIAQRFIKAVDSIPYAHKLGP